MHIHADATWIAAVAVGAAMALAGCASPGPFEPWIDAAPGVGSAVKRSGSHPDDAPVMPAAGAAVSDYVRLAMQRNPSIRAAEHRVEAARARAVQATGFDDPMLTVSPIGEMAQTASGEVGLMAGISQQVPFPGKRGARGRVADARAAIAEAALREVRLDVATRVRLAFWDHRFAVRSLEVVEESRALLEQLRGAAEAAYRSGTANQQDVLRASVELAAIDRDRLTLEQRLAAAAAQLNALVDRPVDAPLPDHAGVDTADADVDLHLADLLARAAAHNPQLAKSRRRIEAARQRLDLARLERFPDVNVGLQYNRVMDEGLSPMSNGEDQWWLRFSINLPIWTGRLDAMRTEARQQVLAGLASLHAAHNAVAAELQTLLAQVDLQRRLVALFRDTLTPGARQTLDASLATYRAGRGDFAAVVDNARRLLEFRRMQDRAETGLQKRIAEIRRVVGGRIISPAKDMNRSDKPDEVSP